ncbi:MAG: hypothetical protein R3B81_01715 [bacterium]
MKRKIEDLQLRRQTIRRLDRNQTREVEGGAVTPGEPCVGTCCVSNSCDLTCDATCAVTCCVTESCVGTCCVTNTCDATA